MAKKLEEMRIRPSANGGHTVIHEYKREAGKKSGSMSGGIYMERPANEEHTFGSGAAETKRLTKHIAQHLDLSDIETDDSNAPKGDPPPAGHGDK